MVIDFVRCSRLRKLVERWERMGVVKTKEVLAMTSAKMDECLGSIGVKRSCGTSGRGRRLGNKTTRVD